MLPFTPDQFFQLFAEYNRSFWLAALVQWVAVAGALVATWRTPSTYSRLLTFVVTALWAWAAVAYHAWLFTRINQAAWLFAGLFAIESALLAWVGVRRRIDYFSSSGWTRRIGLGLSVYALAYPLLAIAAGHHYPASPTFGVPCPTVILTVGVLLTVRGTTPVWLAAIPMIWAFVGGSAAFVLGVAPDYVLLGSGVVLLVAVVRPITRTLAQT